VISLLKSVSELDQITALHDAATKTLEHAITTSAQYAVELNAHDIEALREHLAGLASQVGGISAPQDYETIRSAFRGEVRNYRDKCSTELGRLRGELNAASEAMQTFATGVSASSEEHATEVEKEFALLEEAATCSDLEQMRQGITRATTVLRQSCEQMQASNRLVISQLQDEIRALHQAIDQERRESYTDHELGVWNRDKLDSRMEDLLRRDDPFWVLLLAVQNSGALAAQFPRPVVADALKGMLKRLNSLVGEDATIGRWNHDAFGAILDVPLTATEALREKAAQRLSGDYPVQHNGASINVTLKIGAAVAERVEEAGPSTFYPRLGSAAATVVEG